MAASASRLSVNEPPTKPVVVPVALVADVPTALVDDYPLRKPK
jgi:hypothetical protein